MSAAAYCDTGSDFAVFPKQIAVPLEYWAAYWWWLHEGIPSLSLNYDFILALGPLRLLVNY
jgi:hypothetical protein